MVIETYAESGYKQFTIDKDDDNFKWFRLAITTTEWKEWNKRPDSTRPMHGYIFLQDNVIYSTDGKRMSRFVLSGDLSPLKNGAYYIEKCTKSQIILDPAQDTDLYERSTNTMQQLYERSTSPDDTVSRITFTVPHDKPGTRYYDNVIAAVHYKIYELSGALLSWYMLKDLELPEGDWTVEIAGSEKPAIYNFVDEYPKTLFVMPMYVDATHGIVSYEKSAPRRYTTASGDRRGA